MCWCTQNECVESPWSMQPLSMFVYPSLDNATGETRRISWSLSMFSMIRRVYLALGHIQAFQASIRVQLSRGIPKPFFSHVSDIVTGWPLLSNRIMAGTFGYHRLPKPTALLLLLLLAGAPLTHDGTNLCM